MSSIDEPNTMDSFRGNETILLVEDDEFVRRLTQRLLEQAGYRVVLACDGEEAICVFDQQRDQIDLVVLDLILPKKNGRIVYDHIHGCRPAMPVLFVTGYNRAMLDSTLHWEAELEVLQKTLQPHRAAPTGPRPA
jgi:CheY-like chemotaxis protein